MAKDGISNIGHNGAIKHTKATGKTITQPKKPETVPVGQSKEKKAEPVELNPYTEAKINYVEIKRLELEKQRYTTTGKEKENIEKEIKNLEKKSKLQKETAKLTGDEDGNISFTIKKPITAKEFKKLFDVQEGALRDQVSYSYQNYPKGTPEAETGGQFIKYNDDELFEKGKKIKLPPSSIDNQGTLTELWNRFTN